MRCYGKPIASYIHIKLFGLDGGMKSIRKIDKEFLESHTFSGWVKYEHLIDQTIQRENTASIPQQPSIRKYIFLTFRYLPKFL